MAQLVLPLLVASLSELLLSFVDVAIVGHLGIKELAAISTSAAIFSLIAEMLLAASVGFSIRAARAAGAGRIEEISEAAFHTLAILCAGSVLATIFLWTSGRALPGFISRDPEVARLAYKYLSVRGATLPLIAFGTTVRICFDVVKKTSIGMRAALLSNLLNGIFSFWFVFGGGPIPAMGIVGSALGTVVAEVAAAVYLGWQFRKLAPVPFPRWQWRNTVAQDLFTLSVPEITNMGIDYLGNFFFIAITGSLGSLALAGSRIALVLMTFFFVVALNFGLGIQILVGRALGAGDPALGLRLYREAQHIALALFAFLAVLTYVGRDLLILIFTSSPEVGLTVRGSLGVVALSLPLMAWTTTQVGMLRANAETRGVLIANVLAVWLVQIPSAWIATRFGLGLGGIYFAYFLYFLVRGSISYFRLHRPLAVLRGEAKGSYAPSE